MIRRRRAFFLVFFWIILAVSASPVWAMPGTISEMHQCDNPTGEAVVCIGSISASYGECTYTLLPSFQNFPSSSGTATVSVIASAGSCSWTAKSNDNWITISSGSSGTGNGMVSYGVSTNTGGARTGTLSIAGMTITINQTDTIFSDVPSTYWAYPSIISIYNASITNGCLRSPLTYCYSGTVTRGQMAAFIIRAEYGENFTYTKTPYFTDVPVTSPYFAYVQKMADDAVTNGCGGGNFCVSDALPRDQLAALIIRAKFGDTFTYTQTPYFSDVPSSQPFFKYIQKMKDSGYTTAEGTYYPDVIVTRDQMAAFIARAFLGSTIQGPRIGLVTTSEATISWDTDSSLPGTVEYGVGTDLSQKAVEPSATTHHRITLTGLSSDTQYSFRVKTGTETSGVLTFRTATTKPDAVFQFITMADTRGNSDQADLISLPAEYLDIVKDASKRDAAFAVHVGDIFYGYTPDINMARELYASFKKASNPLAQKMPHLVNPGGHEMSPNKKGLPPGFDPLALWNEQFAQPFVLNGYQGTVFSWDWGSAHFVSVDTNHYTYGESWDGLARVSDEQIAWLEHDLTAAQRRGARHLFVLGHTNAFRTPGSALFYQGSVDEAQRDKFWNVLVKYKVTAYITGHEHLFNDQLGEQDVAQWLNGNSGAPLGNPNAKYQYTIWSVKEDSVTAYLTDKNGQTDYTRIFPVTQPQPETLTKFRKGPYLLYPSNSTSMKVMWQTYKTPSVSEIEWGKTASYGSRATVTESGSGEYEHQFSHSLEGLTSGTRYYYRITADGEKKTGSFMTASSESSSSLVFYGYGDTILSRPNLNSVSEQIVSRVQQEGFEKNSTFVLHSGDIAWDGNEEPYPDSYFDPAYQGIEQLLSSMPVMGSVGNHEGQVPKGDPIEDLGMLFRKYWPHNFVARNYYSFDYGPLHVTVVDQYHDFTADSPQLTWIDQDLGKSTKPWKIVLFHQSPYGSTKNSNGPYENEIQAQDARNYLVPILKKHGIKLTVNGHEHVYARSVVDGITYLVLGGGGAPPFKPSAYVTPKPSHVVAGPISELHFGRFEILDSKTLKVEVISNKGDLLDSFTISQ